MSEIPTMNDFLLPLLQVLDEHAPVTQSRLCDIAIDKQGLSEAQKQEVYETSGKLIAKNRAGWAAVDLKLAGAIRKREDGRLELGDNARELLAKGEPFTRGELTKFPEWQQYQEDSRARAAQKRQEAVSPETSPSPATTPEDMIEAAFRQLDEVLVEDLLELIRAMPPEAFERLVLQVLAALGYGGGDPSAIQGVPRGPDGGIDGKIKEDKLGLDQIYVQAKRYSGNSVGAPAVREFVGVMTTEGCRKGVFVTSSEFTKDAQEVAERQTDNRLSLIDGPALAQLMITHGVGVQVANTYKVNKVDRDFFGEYE